MALRDQGERLAELGQRNERQADYSLTLTSEYKKFPLSFTPKADSADAAFEIAGTGSGDFHIGAVSLMPADNVQGFRPDTIALLKQLHSGMWRLPGGNFLSTGTGTTPSAISTSGRPCLTTPGTPCR